MSQESTLHIYQLIRRFGFDNWDGEELLNPKLDFVGRWDSSGARAGAITKSVVDAFVKMSPSEARAAEVELTLHACANVDMLFERSKESASASRCLLRISLQLLEGLNDLAASGNEDAARSLFTALSTGVRNFTILASRKPDVFLSSTRTAGGMPSFLTVNSESMRDGQDLLRKLQVSSQNPLAMFRTGKGARLKTPTTIWAVRLFNHIMEVRAVIEGYQATEPCHYELMAPPWTLEALALPEFSKSSWSLWADLAWKIIEEAADGHPENVPQLHAIGHDGKQKQVYYRSEPTEATQVSNVVSRIKERLSAAFKKLAAANR